MPRNSKRTLKKTRKTRNLQRKRRGGKYLLHGSFGCTYTPSVRCQTPSGNILSSANFLTKYISKTEAEKEIDAGLLIEEAFKEEGLSVDPSSIILYPKQQCTIPMNLTTNELTENPIRNCPIPITDPVLLQMPNGGVDLFGFRCPPQDVRIYLNSILELVEGLRILHSAEIVHMDIKVGNIVTKKVNNTYQTRFIDVGFVQDLTKYDIAKPFPTFAVNYMIWPFETKFLVVNLINVHFGLHKAGVMKNIEDFATMVQREFPKFNIPLGIYIRGNHFLLLDPTHTDYSPIFSKNMDFLISLYNQRKNYEDVTDFIAKATDVYSLGLALYDIYARVTNQVISQNMVVRPFRSITSDIELSLFHELRSGVTQDVINLILQMVDPLIERRMKDLNVIKAELAPMFDKVSTIFEKYYPPTG